MKKSFDDYTLLHHGRHKGSLWLGSDHLLIIEKLSLFGTLRESYRRIDYDRIQAVMLARTETRDYITVVLGFIALVLVLCLVGAIIDNSPALAGVFGVLLAVVAGGIIRNQSLGPSAGLIVRTAVRPWKLAPVRRLRVGERVAAELAARCAAFQGGELMDAADLPEAGSVVDAAGIAPPPLPAHLLPVDEDTVPPHASLGWGYGCLAIFGLMIAGEAYLKDILFTYAMMAFGAATVIFMAIAISRRGGLASTGSRICWFAAAGLLAVAGLSGYVIAVVASVSGRIRGVYDLGMAPALAGFPESNSSGGAIFLMILGTAQVAAAVFGLFAASRRRLRLRAVMPAGAPGAANSGSIR